MRATVGFYAAIARKLLEEATEVAYADKHSAIKKATAMAGPENTDYVVIRIEGIMQATVQTEFIEQKE